MAGDDFTTGTGADPVAAGVPVVAAVVSGAPLPGVARSTRFSTAIWGSLTNAARNPMFLRLYRGLSLTFRRFFVLLI